MQDGKKRPPLLLRGLLVKSGLHLSKDVLQSMLPYGVQGMLKIKRTD